MLPRIDMLRTIVPRADIMEWVSPKGKGYPIISADRLRPDEMCAGCLKQCDNAKDNTNPWMTHVRKPGTRPHAFHRSCLMAWVNQNPQCPICNVPIDVNSQFTKTERFFVKLNFALVNAALATALSAAKLVAVAATGEMVVAIKSKEAKTRAAVDAAAATALLAIAVSVITVSDQTSKKLGHNFSDSNNVLFGVCMSVAAMLFNLSMKQSVSVSALAKSALVGGAATGVLSLLRRRETRSGS